VAVKHFLSRSHDESEERVTVGSDDSPKLVDRATGRELTPAEEEAEVSARSSVPIKRGKQVGFWGTVMVIELTDIAFAIDSILAAIAVVGSAPSGHVGPHPKLWVVVTGGILGVVLMRFAAAMFIRLLERFPRFETAAYLLVLVIGSKLVVDWGANSEEHPHVVNFHDTTSLAFWLFWLAMAICIGIGFLPSRKHEVEKRP
jgi:predicted tellurium resistance membrane protein TerC